MAGFDFDEIPDDNSEEREKLLSVQTQALERLGSPEARAAFDSLRDRCAKRKQFEDARVEKLVTLLASICEQHGVELEWVFTTPGTLFPDDGEVSGLHRQIDELIRFCDPGPSGLDKNDCVEIQGLESESGKPNNGKKAVVTRWLPDKGRYEVQISGEKLLTLKPENVRKLGELEKLRCVQKQAAEILSTQEAQSVLDKQRGKASNVMQYMKLRAEALPQLISPACEHHGVDVAWRAEMLAANANDPISKASSKKMEELSAFGTLGPSKFEKGACYEVSGLSSEAGQKLNGTAVIVRGWNQAKERYDTSPLENPGEVKAMKAENLLPITDKQFTSAEEATSMLQALQEAYRTPASQEKLVQLKAANPDFQKYMAALRPALLELQSTVLERFGFRPDAVGQHQLQRALAAFEEEPAVAQQSREVERLLGLRELRFDGRVAIVTGGGRGLGRAYCKLLAARGAKVVVNNRTASKADEVAAEITASGGTAVAEHSNVALGGDKVVAAALHHFGRVDIVVCNAGQLEDKRLVNMGLEDFASVLNTHVMGHFRLVKAAWPHFAKQKYGRIVLISSEAGLHGNFGQLNYSAAKGALMSMGQTMAMEGFKDGILANVICTEGVTRMTNGTLPEEQRISEEDLAKAQQPAAAPVAYLCHETCKATSGIFRVDNGHVQAFRWQTDEAFVDFDPGQGDASLETVAERWRTPEWQRVSYRGDDIHAHGFARSMAF
mmetsp:Transcript_74905/g.236742  ORF Transcript_74905/g.236742 Transcript_74905/m.236742 type:complete len:724 (+) Transcript_74905:70-2241(+)